MSFTLPALAVYASYVKNRFVQKTRRMMETQEHFLHELLAAHQHTELGQKFGLKDIKTIDQFRAQVPLWSYLQYEPYTERIAQGENNILNPDRVTYINLTSGSTGKKKQVPVTHRFQKTLRRADLAGMGFALEGLKRRHRKFGKLFITNSVQVQGRTSAGIEYGPVSVGSIRKGKPLFEQAFAHPFRALEISDTLARHYVCLLFALREPQLRGMVANFPMLILRTCGYLEEYAEALIHDLEHGTIAPWLPIEPDIRAELERRWNAHPQRATQLKAAFRTEGRLTPKLAWPQLSFVTTARGGTSGFYLERFPDYFADTPVFGGVYGTAEATFGVYPDFDTDGSILAIESGFFEFIPADQWGAEHPKTLLPEEVKVGDRYRIAVTTYSGFYRYDIGDVVEVVGFYEQTPLIVFRHRHGGLLSSTTEKTTEFHVTQVMQQLQHEFHVHLDDFCVTLSDQEFPARYLVNIELVEGQQLEQPMAFIQRFEYWMREFNNPYGTVREGQVPPPRLRILAPGSFTKVRQRHIERGMFDSQLKIPHISEDRHLLAGLPVLQEVDLQEEGVAESRLPSWNAQVPEPAQPSKIPGLEFSQGAHLLHADLRRMDLRGVDLRRADLSGADLSGADLRGANLSGAFLREANLNEANLVEANLQGADLTDATLIGTCLQKVCFHEAYVNRARFDHADLTGAQFCGAVLWQVSFQEANLTHVDFEDAQMKDVTLMDATLDGTRLVAHSQQRLS
ncbi:MULTISPECIES: GH3 auxin-responsive promoter family protein [unclassified Leptolyngbya]|uniref:GH3 family domain-containing protein n=1 Tax=unclassified Leptolyngbya TaxID=2650499 RepID=UPI001686B17D|nr:MULTISPECIES: GH3 auxin-responsive promoter family protein [unclassified Leptolyngbya]MBD1911346.1 GH3 auxin-responsive promoter family protein [Leptolyngbya sp. FACHB-8]MBD2156636.1 GH3 auxin-responsive promoter family protein [Leptolyngbya sp. FACHB-16]